MITDLSQLPAVAAYLRRVGAEAMNFKTATVTEMRNGYPFAAGRITFGPSGSVSVHGDAAPPTPEEREAIAADFEGAEFPKLITLAAIGDGPPDCDLDDPKTFICHDFDGQVVMVHQRYQTKDGGKGFIPWTRWSDGKWRKMEPEVMPFYGLPGAKEHSTLYIHEGSKAASRVRRIIEGREPEAKLPWLENMRYGAHIGWIGGVHALERSDWTSLAKLGWRRVVIVADNDQMGKNVVPQIAKYFRCPTFTLQFTEEWPDRFDLGDDWPEKMFGDEGQYIGIPYERCIQPATWATDEIEVAGETPTGRPTVRVVPEIRDVFAEQWAWIEKVDQMVNLEMPNYRLKSSNFNAFVRSFSHSKDTLELFHRFYSGNQMDLTYDPSNEATIVRNAAGLQAVNLYQPSPVKPTPGDYGPWLDFMAYLIPSEADRAHVMRWIATLRARPATRMVYGILLMSEQQGIGKGTLGRILAELVGRANTAFPGESMITNSDFNGWIEGKRLIVVDEIYSGHSWKAYNKLKPYVSDETIEVNVKHQATWSMPNWTHYLLMSNSKAALKLETSDRRWMVPEVAERPWTEAQFQTFNEWLYRGGLAIIAHWAHTYEQRGEGKYVRPGEISPMSASKAKLIEESKSEAEQEILSLASELREAAEPIAILLPDLRAWVATRVDERVFETAQAVTRIVKGAGLWVLPPMKVGGAKQAVIVNKEEMTEWEPGRVRDAIRAASTVIEDPM